MTAIWEWYARCYDSVATLRPYREMVGTVIGAAGSEPPGRVLDAGCGTGNVTAAAREAWPYARIVAVDRSPAMLSRARRKVSGATFVRGDLDGDLSEIGGCSTSSSASTCSTPWRIRATRSACCAGSWRRAGGSW